MPISDSDPERRNLIVASWSFLAYFWGGGTIPNDKISLPMIQMEFESPVVLAVMAWVMFFWFFYRYWQKHVGDFSSNFKEEFTGKARSLTLRAQVARQLDVVVTAQRPLSARQGLAG